MKTLLFSFLLLGLVASNVVRADDAEEDAKHIVGTWAVTKLVSDGNIVQEENFKNIRVVNETGNVWSLCLNGKETSRGTNVLDATKTPKLVDFYITDGDGRDNHYLGIYELDKNTRKLCFVPSGTDRPTDFNAPAGSQRILMVFKRLENE